MDHRPGMFPPVLGLYRRDGTQGHRARGRKIMEDMDKVQDYETMIAEMRAAGDANQRHLAGVERSRGAISQIRYRSTADPAPIAEPTHDSIANLEPGKRY